MSIRYCMVTAIAAFSAASLHAQTKPKIQADIVYGNVVKGIMA